VPRAAASRGTASPRREQPEGAAAVRRVAEREEDGRAVRVHLDRPDLVVGEQRRQQPLHLALPARTPALCGHVNGSVVLEVGHELVDAATVVGSALEPGAQDAGQQLGLPGTGWLIRACRSNDFIRQHDGTDGSYSASRGRWPAAGRVRGAGAGDKGPGLRQKTQGEQPEEAPGAVEHLQAKLRKTCVAARNHGPDTRKKERAARGGGDE